MDVYTECVYYKKCLTEDVALYIHLIQKRLLWVLGIGHWEAIVWRSLKQSISLFSYAQTIASQCPITNAQSNLY